MNPRMSWIGMILFCSSIWTYAAQEPDCSNLKMGVSPRTVTVDHAAASPDNQAHFRYRYIDVPQGCASPAIAIKVDWSVSDSSAVQVDLDGVATCAKPTATPVTVTATSKLGTSTAQITCK